MDIRKLTPYNIKSRGWIVMQFIKKGRFPEIRNRSFWFPTEWGWFKCPDYWTPGLFVPDYEPGVRKMVGSLRGSLFINVGANVGLYTVIAARNGNKVVAIEPSPKTFRCLSETIKANGLRDRVSLVNAAAWRENGMLKFYEAADATVSHVEGVRDGDPRIKTVKQIVVEAVTLDALLEEEPSLILIDAEGVDEEVLRGAPRIIGQGVPVIFDAWTRKHLDACKELLGTRRITKLDERNYLAA